MRKIIEGKSYNTKTAELLADVDDGEWGSCRYISEKLYKTKNGQYFICGEGGALTKYAEYEGNNSFSGWDIYLLSEKEAKAWGEDNLCSESYIRVFGEVEEG